MTRPRPLTVSVAALLTAPLPFPWPAQSGGGHQPEQEGGLGFFVDATEAYGVWHDHKVGAPADTGGSGAAWFDMDLDGDEDLFVLSFAHHSQLFRNEGPAFTDVTAGSGVHPADALGVIVGDYDADGLDDLYVCTTTANHLYRNLGGGAFQDRAPELGLVGGMKYSECASWADFDSDGDIDLYVGNYIDVPGFPNHIGYPNELFRNDGPSTAWPELAANVGVDGVYPNGVGGALTGGCTLVTNTLDYDEDGDPDIQVGNDFGQTVVPNNLYRNDTQAGQLLFADVGAATGFDIEQYCMGIKARDYDHDGDWDFYSTDIGPNALLRNDGGVFTDVTYEAGPVVGWGPRGFTFEKISSWGIVWEDLNLDSWEDLIVMNGFVPASAWDINLERVPNDLWLNRGDGTFERVPDELSGLHDEGPGRSCPHVDLNRDGLLDLYVTNNGNYLTSDAPDHHMLLLGTRQFVADGMHWLELTLEGRISHRNAFGTRIEADLGGRPLKRQHLGDGSYLDSPSHLVHFGLGARASVDELRLQWPSGIEQTLIDVVADQVLTVREPVVTLEALLQPTHTQGQLVLSARLRNRDTVDLPVAVDLELVPEGASGWSGTVEVQVAAGAERVVRLAYALPATELAAFQGSAANLVGRISAAAGEDHGRRQVQIP